MLRAICRCLKYSNWCTQVVLQLLFIADVARRRVHLPEHDRSKPGRQVVTFLLICNVTMWVIYTFEAQKVIANPVQVCGCNSTLHWTGWPKPIVRHVRLKFHLVAGSPTIFFYVLFKKMENTAIGIRHAGLYSQKLALTSPTSGGRTVGIVRSRTKATGFVCLFLLFSHTNFQLVPRPLHPLPHVASWLGV
jgi:hypothetical protein